MYSCVTNIYNVTMIKLEFSKPCSILLYRIMYILRFYIMNYLTLSTTKNFPVNYEKIEILIKPSM